MDDGAVAITWLGSVVGVGVLSGLAGALVTIVSMKHHPEGWTPAVLLAGLVRRTDPEQVSVETAIAVHHAGGAFAGLLYALLFAGLSILLPWHGRYFGFQFVPHLLAVLFDALLVYGAFAHVLFPLVRRHTEQQRETAIRGQWLRSVLVYAATLTILAPPLLLFWIGLG